jgi:hypothetical protein
MDNKTKMVTSGLFIPVALILLAQTAAPRFLAIREGDFAPPELQKIPYQMGKWQAHGDQTLDRGVTEYLRPDEYMLRDYADKSTGRTIGLFVPISSPFRIRWVRTRPVFAFPAPDGSLNPTRKLRLPCQVQRKTFP